MVISKTLVVLGLLLATALFLSSMVDARGMAEKPHVKEAGVTDQKYGGYPGGGYPGGGYPPRSGYYPSPGRGRCYHGCCGRGYYGGCRCCATADEIPEAAYLPDPKQ